MTSTDRDTTPYWSDSASFPRFARLDADTEADVLVVGAGITGLTAAYGLASAGRSIVVIDRGRCASVDTGHTSAHLTMVTDTRLSELAGQLGRSHAQAVWDAGLAAIARIDEIVRRHEIDCAFDWVEGYLHLPPGDAGSGDVESLRRDAELAAELGFDATFVDQAPLVGMPGVRVDGQARVHPRRYLAGLAKAIVAAGGRIHEHTEAGEFSDSPRSVTANGHRITCANIVIATHNPLVGLGGAAGATLLPDQARALLELRRGGPGRQGRRARRAALGHRRPLSLLSASSPTATTTSLILGGEDHKTGQAADTAERYARLEQALAALAPGVELTHRWSGQVIETPDGLPYIGATAEHQYAGTGFAGNGITFGTLAGMMIADRILGRTNPWSDLFDPARKALRHGLWDYLKENTRLSLLPDPRPLRGSGGTLAAGGEARGGQGHRARRQEGRRLPRPGRRAHGPLGHVHPHGVPGALESQREDLGLPLSRVPLRAGRRGDLRAGGVAIGGVTWSWDSEHARHQ